MVDVRKRAVLAGIVLLVGVVILSFAAYSRIMAGPEPQYPEGVPRDVPLLKPAEGATDVPKISTHDSSFLIPCDEGVRIHVLFEERKSVNGLWRGSAPMLRITGPYGNWSVLGQFSGDTNSIETWGTRLTEQGDKGIEPYIMVTFLVGKEYVHKWAEATASVEIAYPIRTEGGFSISCPSGRCFLDHEEHLSRDLRFFVLSADESRAVGQYVKWHDSRGNEERLFIASILFISIGLVAVFRGRLRRGAVIAAFLFVVIVGAAGYYYYIRVPERQGGVIEPAVTPTTTIVRTYEPAVTRTTATPTTAIVRSYDLVDAVNEGVIEVEIIGTGYAAGDVIRMKITPRLDISIDIEITPGLILINSGSGQSMIIAEARTIAVKPKIELDFIIEAYCLDPDKDNPSSKETFSVQNVPGIYGQDVIRFMKSLAQLPRSQKPVAAVQIAVWVITDDISKEDIRIKFSSGDITAAKQLLQNAGIDISSKRLFPAQTTKTTQTRQTTTQTIEIQTSYTFVQTLTAQSTSPGATSQGEWKTIAAFTGLGDGNTTDFTVLADYWRIVYTVKTENERYGFFAAFVFPSGETTSYVAHLRWAASDHELRREELRAGPGDFWIEVLAANLESWTIEVQTQE